MSSIHMKAQNLHYYYGDICAVEDISFDLEKGSVIGILGPNGAGKTTTIRMISGYLSPHKGSVTIFDKDLSTHTLSIQQQIGYLPEGGPLYSDMTPGESLTFIAQIRGLKGAYLQERLYYVKESLELNLVWHQTINTLSKGFKRRVALAQAIIHDPIFLILDEPTDGLDPNQKQEVRSLIQSLAKDKMMILSTHILEEAEKLCSKVVVIAKGVVCYYGTVANFARLAPEYGAVILSSPNPLSDKMRSKLLDSSPLIEAVVPWDEKSVKIIPHENKSLLQEVANFVHKETLKIEALYELPGHFESAFTHITKAKDSDLIRVNNE